MSAFTEAAKRLKKPKPKLIDKRKQRHRIIAKDRAENVKVAKRSKGQCEVTVLDARLFAIRFRRCLRCAFGEPHHLISGIGRRNRGDSILSEHKIAVCKICHCEIHGHVLKPLNEADRYHASTVVYHRDE